MQCTFTAKKSNFQDEPGYMFAQYLNCEKVCEQFIAASVYEEFLEAAGISQDRIRIID